MRQLALGRSLAWIGWGTVAVLAVSIGVVALRLLSFNPEAVTEELRPNLMHHPVPRNGAAPAAPAAALTQQRFACDLWRANRRIFRAIHQSCHTTATQPCC